MFGFFTYRNVAFTERKYNYRFHRDSILHSQPVFKEDYSIHFKQKANQLLSTLHASYLSESKQMLNRVIKKKYISILLSGKMLLMFMGRRAQVGSDIVKNLRPFLTLPDLMEMLWLFLWRNKQIK